ncbi:hypothetical protein ACIGNX_06965 [Actinosynnema sp. NPDC053489]|uniref:hypothetical protein n=1 Tax=Actinosynnema sp. NPDC053489 TaxID=3363916 RepID=UPI0037C51F27
MDEQRLSELFRDAARDAPPPSFDVAAVRSASARATARRRSAIAAGSALAVALVFGGLVVGSNLARDPGGDLAAAGSAHDASSPNVTPFSAGEPEMMPKDASPDPGGEMPLSLPDDPSAQGDEPSGSADRPSVGNAQRGCVEVDRELAVALADELPVANADQASAPLGFCPPAERGASLPVRDGDVRGTVSVVVAPVGAAPVVPDPADAYASAKTSAGEDLFVISRSDDGGVDPFQAQLPGLAARLAARI